jgi:hypothetical protein
VCECGRTLPAISPVIIKEDDWVATPSGRRISSSAIYWLFEHQDISGIRRAQIVQEDIASVKVYVDADEPSYLKCKPLLEESLREVFFGEMDVDVVRADLSKVMQSGKMKFVVNKLRKGSKDAAVDAESQDG